MPAPVWCDEPDYFGLFHLPCLSCRLEKWIRYDVVGRFVILPFGYWALSLYKDVDEKTLETQIDEEGLRLKMKKAERWMAWYKTGKDYDEQ